MKNQAVKEGKDIDGKSGFKHSANMLFGSQFLREVYADDDKSMSRISDMKDTLLGDRNVQGKTLSVNMKMFQTPAMNVRARHGAAGSDFISPQAKQKANAKKI